MKKYTTCIHLLDYLLRYASDKGLDRELICAGAGVDPALFENPDARVRAATFTDIWQHISRTLADDMFGLNLGRSLQHFPFGHIAVAVMLNSNNLLSAFHNLIRYHNLMSDIGRPTLVPEQGGLICFSVQPQSDVPFHDLHYIVFIFSMIVSLLRYLSSDQTLHPISIEVTGAGNYPGLAPFFNADIVFQRPVSRMTFKQKDLSGKILFSDPDLLRVLKQTADQRLSQLGQSDAWRDKVRRIFEAEMSPEPWRIETVAEMLHLEIRTLQNYLRRENTCFRMLYMEFRKQKAIRLLGNPSIAMIDIAFILGFSEQSAFNHALKKWTGVTPFEYRLGRRPNS